MVQAVLCHAVCARGIKVSPVSLSPASWKGGTECSRLPLCLSLCRGSMGHFVFTVAPPIFMLKTAFWMMGWIFTAVIYVKCYMAA